MSSCKLLQVKCPLIPEGTAIDQYNVYPFSSVMRHAPIIHLWIIPGSLFSLRPRDVNIVEPILQFGNPSAKWKRSATAGTNEKSYVAVAYVIGSIRDVRRKLPTMIH